MRNWTSVAINTKKNMISSPRIADGGTLDTFISTHHQNIDNVAEFSTVMRILTGIARAIAYLHAVEPKPILHRDIKCENVLLSKKMDAKLTDLGEARIAVEEKKMTMVGTYGYTAPEIVSSSQKNNRNLRRV